MSHPDRPEENAMSTKEMVLRAVRELPDDATLDEILDAILLRLKVRRGRQQIQRGETLTHEEVRERLARWLG
jgi:hypothetical protein